MLLLFAAVDDEVTAEEAAYVDSCTQTLIAAAEAKGDSFPPAGLYHLHSQCIQDPDASKSGDNSR